MFELKVISTKHHANHQLEIHFNDGHISIVDFAPFIFSVNHPDYEIYKQPAHFLNYKIVDGNLQWGDYTMIFPIMDLYNNTLMYSD